jgi:multisubunit Na+/H+ antiporter MnhE subunit
VGFVSFIVHFLRALVIANVQVARAVLFQRCEDLAPGFLCYPVEGLSKLEILVLSHCITLTPGTTTVEISADFTRLVVHAFDARDPEATVSDIQRELEAPILRWTR